MKKIILSSISLVLVAAITLIALAAAGPITNPKIDEVVGAPYEDGAAFMTSENPAPRYTDAEGLKAVDKNLDTKWVITTEGSYTQLTLDKFTSINNIHITENNSRIRKYHIEAWDGTEWIKVYNNDLIEGYYCAAIEPIKTDAIRFYADTIKIGSTPEIAELDVSYQRPVEYNREFINASYLSSNMFFQEYHNNISTELFDSLTDIIMIGNFCFDQNGNFLVTQEQVGTGDVIAAHPALSDEAEMLMKGEDLSQLPAIGGVKLPANKKGFLPVMRARYGEKTPRLHFSLTFTNFNGGTAANMAAFNTPAVRTKFVQDVVDFTKKFEFGGADIDWEYPGNAIAWNSYRALVNELAEALHAEGILFSTAQSSFNMQLGVDAMNKFDTINMMSYDQINGAGQHSSYSRSTIEDIERYIDAGIKPEKMVLGTAWYSSQGQLGWNNMLNKLQANTPEGEEFVLDPGVNLIYGAGEQVEFSFNNHNLLRDRVLYAVKRKLGGVFSWQMTCDTPYNEAFSLGKVQKDTIDKYVVRTDLAK